MALKIATWNVNGIRARNEQLRTWLAQERPDVVCLQEIKATREQIPPELDDLPEHWAYWHGERAYSGVAVLVRRELCPDRPVCVHPEFDMETRIAIADVAGLSIASVYVPNGGKDYAGKLRFLQALIDHAEGQRGLRKNWLLCGDINIAHADIDVHPKERKASAIGQLPEERALLSQLLAAGLVDVARQLYPNDDQLFTWWAPWRSLRQRNIGWRIDYILASGAVAERATGFASQREVGTSDHAPVVATFDW